MAAFHPFGPDHVAVLALTAAVAVAVVGNAARLRRLGNDRFVRLPLAIALLGNEVGGYFVYRLTHGTWRLPLQLCDLAMIAMGWALLGGPRLVSDVAVCWGLGASLQAVLTPDLGAGFPSLEWLTFFLGHCLMVWSAVYVMARGRHPLTVGSVWRVWLVTNGYAALIGLVNWRWGTNFGYLAHKPAHPSLLDALGPWPVYLVGMEVIGLLSFLACVGLSRIADRLAAHAA